MNLLSSAVINRGVYAFPLFAAFLCAALAPPLRPQAPQADPASAFIEQGNQAYRAHHYDDAIKDYEKANKARGGRCAPCYLAIAQAQLHSGKQDDALKSSDKALEFASDDDLRVKSHIIKGDLLEATKGDSKKLKLAEGEYRAALQIDPQNAALHLRLGTALLEESQDAGGFQELHAYLETNPTGADAEYARKLLTNPRRAGDELAPNFRVQTLQGETISLDQFGSKIVVLDFWATWCPPCVTSVPELKDLTKKYSSEQVVLISMSADDDEAKWRDFIAKRGMDWRQYWDRDARVRKSFGVTAFPTYLVIDQEGFIRERIIGLNPQETVVHRLKDALHAMLPNT